MYTQCPECGVAFRVTADVLKQAAGKVRCGGCGVAFNALNHLSEENPVSPAPAAASDQKPVPELRPDEPGELEADTRPKSISAEQSAALLKTLDQLAGSDIRIEDTGVEWRVLDEDDIDASNAQPDVDMPDADDGDDAAIAIDDEPLPVIDEMRFDDNTPLPDDFEFGEETPHVPESQEPIETPAPEPAPEPMQSQADLDLGAPDEWEDLLGDLDELAAEESAAIEVVAEEDVTSEGDAEPAADLAGLAELEAIDAELQAELEDSREELADLDELKEAAEEIVEEVDSVDEPPDMDTQFAIQAEAMGIDLSGLHGMSDDDDEVVEQAEPTQDDSSETSIEEDLIAAAFEAEAAVQELEEISSKERVLDLDEIEPESEFEEDDEAAEDPEQEFEEAPQEEASEEPEEEAEEEAEEEFDDEPEALDEAELEIDLDVDAQAEEIADDDVQDIALPFDDGVEGDIESIVASLDDLDEPEEVLDELVAAESADADDEHEVPEMTEEEKTINMMIDQELFNMAIEDEDGFASTIVQIQPDKKVDDEIDDNKEEPEKKKKKKKKSQAAPLFETIVMEGESIRKDSDKNGLGTGVSGEDVAASLPFNQESAKRGGRREYDPPGIGMIVGIIALVLLLVVQVLHQSREALATVPAFSNTVGPLYRMLGKPLTPTWDISGWRFEATKGSTEPTVASDESDELTELTDEPEVLTIYSRVGNNSDQALPYPLVHLSLTDRFEDIIGSSVLEPSEYLAENADPRKLVPPGNTFNAVISIESPSADATGFKLNVCYQLASGQLRCAIEDFK